MLVLDTCALIFDALAPSKLGKGAVEAITRGAAVGELAISDISLWEVAMLVARGRLQLGVPTPDFLRNALIRRSIRSEPISPEIAYISVSHAGFSRFDPADRLIGATALHFGVALISSDGPLSRCVGLSVIWQ